MPESKHLGYDELPSEVTALLQQADLFCPIDVSLNTGRTLGRWVVSREAPVGDPVADSLRDFYREDRYGEGWTLFGGLNVHSSLQGNVDFIRMTMAEVENNLALSRTMRVPFLVDRGLYRAYAEKVRADIDVDQQLVRSVQANFRRILDEVFIVMLPEIAVHNAREPSAIDRKATLRLIEEVLELRERREIR